MKRIGCIALLSALLALPARADALYGSDSLGNLFLINLSTGAGTFLGVLPNNNSSGYNEIEYDSLGGRAWAQQRGMGFAIQEFDLRDGAGIGAPIANGASWHGLEYVDATLYAAGFTDPTMSMNGMLATLDPTNGNSTPIGSFGLTAGQITGLAYHAGSDTMYGIDGGAGQGGVSTSTLYTIDLATGAATSVGATGIRAGSLEFGPDGQLYAGGTGDDDRGDLFRLDTATGASTFVGATGFGSDLGNGISGLTLPEPSHPFLYALGTLGLIAWRRRARR